MAPAGDRQPSHKPTLKAQRWLRNVLFFSPQREQTRSKQSGRGVFPTLNPSVLLNVNEPLQAAATVIIQDGLIDRLLLCQGEVKGAARTWTEERKRDDTSTASRSGSNRALRERKKELSRRADGCGR